MVALRFDENVRSLLQEVFMQMFGFLIIVHSLQNTIILKIQSYKKFSVVETQATADKMCAFLKISDDSVNIQFNQENMVAFTILCNTTMPTCKA